MLEVTPRRFLTAALALMLGLGAALWLRMLIPSGALTTPDSLQYLHAARSLRAGQGLTMVDGLLWSDAAYRPLTTWPPLYPIALALAVPDQDRAEVGAGRVAQRLFALAVGLFFIAARRLARLGIAAAATLLLATHPPVLTVYAYAWSEQLFLPIMLLVWLAVATALRRGPPRKCRAWWPYMAAGAAAATATYTRYIGLALFATMLAPLASSGTRGAKGRHRWARVRPVGAALLLATALVAPLLVRNLVLTGHWGGAPRTAPTRSLAANLADLASALRSQLALPGLPAWSLGLLGVALLTIALLWWRGRSARQTETPKDPTGREPAPWLPWGFALVYFGALVILRSAASFDPIDTRLSTPGTVFLVLGIVAVCEGVVRRVAGAARSKVVAAAAALVLLAPAAGQAAIDMRIIRAVRGGESEPFSMTTTAQYINFGRIRPENVPAAVRREAERCRQADAFLITDANPILLHHLLAVKAKALPDTLDDPAVLRRINALAPRGSLVILDARKAARLAAVAGQEWGAVATTHREGQGSVTVVRLPVPVGGG